MSTAQDVRTSDPLALDPLSPIVPDRKRTEDEDPLALAPLSPLAPPRE